NPILYLICGIIGSAACILIAQALGTVAPNRLFAKIGAASLVVFLLHPYFQGAARELIVKEIGSSLWLQLSVPTAVAVIGPTLIWLLAERFGFQWLFRLDLVKILAAGKDSFGARVTAIRNKSE